MQKSFLLFIFYTSLVFSQAPTIQFQKTIGGNNEDNCYSILETNDGGYIAAGRSKSSISGDKTQNSLGDYDIWIVRCDLVGTILWQKTIGGTGGDYFSSIKQTLDGGFIIGSTSFSPISGDKTQNSKGLSDYWIIKITANGIIEWDKTIGGSSEENFSNIELTADGGYIIGGYSSSPISGDKTENYRSELTFPYLPTLDLWIVKINSLGTVMWDKTIGGAGNDILNSIKETADLGFIIGATSNSSISYEKTEDARGNSKDYWILKLNEFGTIQWQKTIGGNQNDELTCLSITIDGGYIVGGNSLSSISGEKTENLLGGNFQYPDIWVLKLNTLGNIEWQNTIGGSKSDNISDIKQINDNGYIIGGYSDSEISYDKTENSRGTIDFWVIKLDIIGTIQWDKTIGGNLGDGISSFQQTNDFGFLLSGGSRSSISGDKSENCRGLSDFWIVKLSPENLSIIQNDYNDLIVYPNPTNNFINLNFNNLQERLNLTIINTLGQIVDTKTFYQIENFKYEIKGANGLYLLTIENEDNLKKTFKIMKN